MPQITASTSQYSASIHQLFVDTTLRLQQQIKSHGFMSLGFASLSSLITAMCMYHMHWPIMALSFFSLTLLLLGASSVFIAIANSEIKLAYPRKSTKNTQQQLTTGNNHTIGLLLGAWFTLFGLSLSYLVISSQATTALLLPHYHIALMLSVIVGALMTITLVYYAISESLISHDTFTVQISQTHITITPCAQPYRWLNCWLGNIEQHLPILSAEQLRSKESIMMEENIIRSSPNRSPGHKSPRLHKLLLRIHDDLESDGMGQNYKTQTPT